MATERFVPFDGIYLLSHSVGRPLQTAQGALQQGYLDPWLAGAADPWPAWLQQVERFRQAVARLLNAEKGQVCPQANLSSALAKLVHSLPACPGRDVILLDERAFPSLGFVVQRAQALGYRMRMADMGTDPARWEAQLGEDVRCALVNQVYSNSGELLPVAAIAQRCRERGIVSIVDACQGVGVIPVDVDEWRADAVLGSSVKWLCGGPGAAFLWIDEELCGQCEPVDVGWFSHEQPFEFDIRSFRYAPDALRFWGGTPDVAPFVVAADALTQLHEIGIGEIRRHNLALVQAMIDALPAACIRSPVEAGARGGTCVLDFGRHQDAVAGALETAGVAFDRRPAGLRLSPHIYNTHREIDAVVETILANLPPG